MKKTVGAILIGLGLLSMKVAAAADERPEKARGAHAASDQDKVVAEEAKVLDLYTVTAFHERLYSAICSDSGLHVWYRGPLARARGKRLVNGGIHPTEDNPRFFLTWAVTEKEKQAGPLLFELSASLEEHPDTVATCVVNKRKLYVRVSHIARGRTLDSPLLEVEEKGMTIRKLLARLEKK